MSPYLKFIKQKHLKMIAYSPFQALLMMVTAGRKGDPEDLQVLTQLITNKSWCTSKYMKSFLNLTNQLFDIFEKTYLTQIPKAQPAQIKNTFRLLEQFLTAREIKELSLDFLKMTNTISDYFEYQNKQKEGDPDREAIIEELESFFGDLPSAGRPLNDFLNELPFQVFLHISAADGRIDSRERARFLEIIKDPESCTSDCTRVLYTGSDYYFKEFLKQYLQGKLKKDLKLVERTSQQMCRIFKKEETDSIKTDLLQLATEIAKASGGIAGIASISRSEKAAILELESIFSPVT